MNNVKSKVAELKKSEAWRMAGALGSELVKRALVDQAATELIACQDEEQAERLSFTRAQEMVAAVREEAARLGMLAH